MASLLFAGDIEVVVERKATGVVKTEPVKFSLVFQCESEEEIKALLSSKGSVVVSFAEQTEQQPTAVIQPALMDI